MPALSPLRRIRLTLACAAAVPALLTGCGAAGSPAALHGRILAVGAENQYANVIAQVGGRYVDSVAIMSNPNTDPHSFEASASVAQTVARARLVVQNGLGYDEFMNKIEAAAHDGARRVIDVQTLRHLPDSTPNPHLWYSPRTMPAVARALAADLSAMEPAHAAYFRAREARFVASLVPWRRALAQFSRRYPATTAATTEPVGDYMLQAAGVRNLTPFSLQADIMNGTDPAPQSVSLQNQLFSEHRVKVFVYNQQVTDSITRGFLAAAARAHVPVVGVYETMPAPGYDYQSWMMAELRALERAVAHGTSTRRLVR
ncbi:MAG TPA: zinc ABC transporter substrate-binding protein [Solirubrobacteraceae bacterium]|nr:zinc ABC transporter substrate-binding protein [Solirubrobacteraceae bacterium]